MTIITVKYEWHEHEIIKQNRVKLPVSPCKVEVRVLGNGRFKSSLSFGAPGREFFTWGENRVIKCPQMSGVTKKWSH